MRWPLYVFELLFGVAAIGLTLRVWNQRGSGWNENLIILPWLAGSVAFAGYLLLLVAANGWQDIPPNRLNATISNALILAGPVSVTAIMGVRLRRRPSGERDADPLSG